MYSRGLYNAWILWILWATHFVLLVPNILAVTLYVIWLHEDGTSISPGYALLYALVLLNFIVEPVEMTLWTYHLLPPWIYLGSQTAKALLWGIVIGLESYVVSKLGGLKPEWLKILIYAMIILTALSFLASLVYGVFICLRHRRRADYERTSSDELMADQKTDRNSAFDLAQSRKTRLVSGVHDAT